MTYDDEPDMHDPEFASGETGQALFRAWAEMNNALPWITILADADDSGKAAIVEEHIVEAIRALRSAENALGMRFIPEDKVRPSQGAQIAATDNKDEPMPF